MVTNSDLGAQVSRGLRVRDDAARAMWRLLRVGERRRCARPSTREAGPPATRVRQPLVMIGPGAVGALPMGVLPTGNLPIGALPSTGCGGGGWERGRSAATAALSMASEAAAAIESLSILHPSFSGIRNGCYVG